MEAGVSVEVLERPKVIKAFTTARGSRYAYDSEGKTTRFKTATGEQHERQDITVFANLNPDEEQEFLKSNHHPDTEKQVDKIYVLERQPDGTPKILRDIAEVSDQSSVFLGILKGDQWGLIKPASIKPVMGYNAFDMRSYQEDGKTMTERHLGNKVASIEY